MTPDPITAEQVRRILLVLCADEVRLASDADPRALTVGTLLDHANTSLFCRSLAREANDNGKLTAAEQRIATHLREKPRRRS